MRRTQCVGAVLIAAMFAGCGETTSGAPAGVLRCVPGASTACACSDGRAGAQRCNAAGTFDPCVCEGTSDGGADASPGDASAPSPCGLPHWIDASLAGTRRGRVTSIDLDQRDFIAGSYAVVPAGCGRDFAVDRRLALRYVMRRDGHLRVTADVNLSSAGPHPVDRIWLASGCATSASVIACEGPSPQSPGEESYVGSLRSRAVLHQGDEVWIFIAAPPTILFVNVAEVADEAAVGSWCDLRETANVCIDGASCVATATGPRCVADGAEFARCRADSSCDASLTCLHGEGATSADRCVHVAAPGDACQRTFPDSALGTLPPGTAFCAGGRCASAPSGDTGRCAVDGSEGGGCLPDGTCAAGLACVRSWDGWGCARSNAEPGARCVWGVTVCAQGESCLDGRLEPSSCARDGASFGRCRAQAPQCDQGLYCFDPVLGASPYCVPVPSSRSCDPSRADSCEMGESCFRGDERVSWCAPTRFERQLCNPLQGGCQSGLSCIGPLYRDDGTCAATPPRGALGQFCRATGQLCDAPWVCLRGFCLHTLHAGDACNVGIGCGPGLTCVGYPMATCRDDGTENANCRTGAPACDAGLECTPGLVCVRPVARGGICSSSQPCERASWCVSPASRCAVDGASGGVCRTGGAPCDAGLSCVDGLCARVVDAGEPCDALNRCAEGIACVSSARTAGAVCIAPGTPGGLCRTAGAACDGSARCVTGTFTTLAPRVLDGALQGVTTTLTLPHCEP